VASRAPLHRRWLVGHGLATSEATCVMRLTFAGADAPIASMLQAVRPWRRAAQRHVGCNAMNIPVGLGILFLGGVAASAGVHLGAALVSVRVRSVVARHPIAHTIWFLLGLAALVVLLVFGVPRRVHSRATITTANWVQATPGCAFLFVLSQRPGAPDPSR
jgi:hypothetical protein